MRKSVGLPPSRYLKRAVSWHDKYITDPLSTPIVEAVARFRWLTPNHVTWVSFAVALVAAFYFWRGSRLDWIIGAFVWEFAYVLDGVDGKLARKTSQMSAAGAMLDSRLDTVKKFVCLVAIVSATPAGRPLLVGLLVIHYALHRIKVQEDPGVLAFLHRRRIKAVFDPLDEYLLLLFLGPLFAVMIPATILTIGLQLTDRAVHAYAGRAARGVSSR